MVGSDVIHVCVWTAKNGGSADSLRSEMSLTMKVRKVADLSYNDGKEISFKGVDGTTWTEGCAPHKAKISYYEV